MRTYHYSVRIGHGKTTFPTVALGSLRGSLAFFWKGRGVQSPWLAISQTYTVIRLLLKRYESLPKPEVSDVIGVDDFAYKKRHTYGIIIINEKTHEPITLLNGRNGDTLREWLKNNKNVKVVTRDRASAYAKVISEELPDAMQVADRFHLHQNLLETIKKALNQEIPATISIPHNDTSIDAEEHCKKNCI